MPEGMDAVEYFHIELETHEVIFAEGTPVRASLSRMTGSASRTSSSTNACMGLETAPAMTPYAPSLAYNGGRAELKALLRLAVSPLVDMRDPIQVAYSRIAARAEELVV